MAGKKQSLTTEEKLARALVPQDQQPYKLPKGWVWTKLENIAELITGNTPSKKEQTYYGNDVPFYKPADLDAGRHVCTSSEYLSKKGAAVGRLIPTGATSVCCIGSIGKCGFIENPGCTNQQITSVIPYFNNLYIYYLCQSPLFQTELIEKSSSTTISIVNKAKMGKCIIPLPPLPEQQRIVARIESLFAKLDAARDKLQQVLDTQEARRAAILHEAFTGRLTGHKGSEEGSSQNILLKDCGTWHGGGTPSKSHEEYWENGDIMWITSKDMKSNLIDSSMVSINKKGVENSSAIYCEKPSVLFVMRSGILRHSFPVAVVKKPYTVNQDLKVLVPNPDILPEYIFWACKASEQNILHQCMKSGTTVESINFQALQQFKIPYYPLNLQEYIVKRINDLMKREDSVSEITQSTLSQIDLLKKSILARAFRGQLGTQDPSDPDARDLLTGD